MKASDYPRDLRGYCGQPPHPKWPDNAKIAVQFVVNYEEGGENCLLHGDAHSEVFLSEIIMAQPYQARHLSMESMYEYGSRAGFWRIYRLFQQYQIPVTVFAVTEALRRNPDVITAMLEAEWEIACHGLKWIHYQDMPREQEAEMMHQAITLHEQLTGSRPIGWYTGRTSPNTLDLVSEQEDLLYCSDSYADDLPYYDCHYQKPLLMVPYTLDVNDMRFATPQGFNTGEQFFQYLKDSFDVLYEEGQTAPKMMSIGLHNRIIGHPGRFAALKRFVEYVNSKERVWLCTREQIARHWLQTHPR